MVCSGVLVALSSLAILLLKAQTNTLASSLASGCCYMFGLAAVKSLICQVVIRYFNVFVNPDLNVQMYNCAYRNLVNIAFCVYF